MTDIQKPFTPSAISKDASLHFSIPLYQRLFEWGDEQIQQLLDDLLSSMHRDKNAPYYVGMLTAKAHDKGKKMELVDGQQRFTAMVLLGITFQWSDFLLCKNDYGTTPRLQFSARDDDKDYLMSKIKGTNLGPHSYKNEKMENGLAFIHNYLCNTKSMDEDQFKEFGDYVFKHLTFFLSVLPEKYNSHELNTYFERMNTGGKSLENHEILKVEIIRQLTSDKELYTSLWNAVSLVEKKILRKHNNEKRLDNFRARYLDSLLNVIDKNDVSRAFESGDAVFDAEFEDPDDTETDVNTEAEKICDIKASPENPFKMIKRRTDEHAPLTFPEFLLQVLFICLDKNIDDIETDGDVIPGRHETEFFDVRKLCDTFKWAMEKRGVESREFLNKMALYRLLMDYFIIRIDDEDDEPYPFILYQSDDTAAKTKVKMYQSMLYAASSAMTYYKWLPDLLLYLEDYVRKNRNLSLPADDFLNELKELDNTWHPMSDINEEQFTFQSIDRYWFWRIDYYLWENRDIFFPKQADKDAAERYIFRRNRSIEHIAPQHPSKEFDDHKVFNWDDETDPDKEKYRDCLGNMVMISSGQNSSLSNSCFEIKQAVVKRYTHGKERVESLKMLYIYSIYEDWSIEHIKEHKEFSFKLLNATYETDEESMKQLKRE